MPDRAEGLAFEKYVTPLKCLCGQIGAANWEKALLPDGRGAAVLVEVSTGFYRRLRKKDVSKTEIVCEVCAAVLAS